MPETDSIKDLLKEDEVNVNVGDSVLVGPEGPQGPQGIQGVQGKSAYEVAVENGYEGSETAWLSSLKEAIDDTKIATDSTWSSTKISASEKVLNGDFQRVASTDEMTNTKYVYVNSSDGNWYYHNGSAWIVGGTFETMKLDENNIKPYNEEIIIKNNIIPLEGWETGKIINATGEIMSYKNCSTSCKKTYVNPGDVFIFIILKSLSELSNRNLRIASYKEDGTWIQNDTLTLAGNNFGRYTVPSDCAYLKMSTVGVEIDEYYPSTYPKLISENLINDLTDYTKNEYLDTKYSLFSDENVVIQDKIKFYPLDKDDKAYSQYQIIKNKYTMQYQRTITTNDYPFFTVYCKDLKENDKLRIKLSDRTYILSVALYPFSNTAKNYDFTYNKKTNEYELIITNEMIENCVTNNKFRVVTRIGSITESTKVKFDLSININQECNNLTDVVNKLSSKENEYKNSTVSILGDSYSTYEGWIPDNYLAWYKDSGNTLQNNVSDVSQTWWYKLIKDINATLLVNCSYSGSTICNTGYNSTDSSTTSFITRMKKWIGEERKTDLKPNLIIIMGGTNDRWAGSPIGEVKYSDWSEEDLKSILPAFCYMLDYLKKWNPSAKIINLVNTELGNAIPNGMAVACEHYNVINIPMTSIDKESGHPNEKGMSDIENTILEYLFN